MDPAPVAPQTDLRARLLELHEAGRRSIIEVSDRYATELGRVVQLDLDIGLWRSRLRSRPEMKIIDTAQRNLAYATFAVSCGLYLQAFANLRLFLELAVKAIYLSVNEIKRIAFERGTNFDWATISNQSDGVFSEAFVKVFHATASSDLNLYASKARKSYGLCSNFVHGNQRATATLPAELAFDDQALRDWAKTAESSEQVVLYCLYCRYGDDLLRRDDGRLSNTLVHSFGHHMSVRDFLADVAGKGEVSAS